MCKVVSQALAWQDDTGAAHRCYSASLSELWRDLSQWRKSDTFSKLESFCCVINFVFKPRCRYWEQVERLFFQERDLCVGRHKCHAALPFRLPFRYGQQPALQDHFCSPSKHASRSAFPQVTISGGSCGFACLPKAAGSLPTTPTPTRSACRTADAHGKANTRSGIC